MLSAETAIGKYPVQVIETMSAIATYTESAWFEGKLSGPPTLPTPNEMESTLAYGAYLVARTLKAKAIIAFTSSGTTARLVACHRPRLPILALSAYPQTKRRLTLSWGVESQLTEAIKDTDHLIKVSLQQAQYCHIAAPGDTIVMIGSTPPYGQSGRTNTLKVERIPRGGSGA